MPQLLRPLIVWLAFILAESLQGAIRRAVTTPAVDLAARQGGVVLGAILIFVLAWVSLRWMHVRTVAGALGVGAMWAVLTLAFEFGLGRLLGASWARLVADYDLAHGGLMGLGLLAMALSPRAALSLRRRRNV